MLPIEAVVGDLWAALETHGRVVLQAPPGAGKTTRIPLYLLERGQTGHILMLEPRRVAARAAAERLAAGLGETVGQRVGYRIRGESVTGSRIEVVTEGVLTRMIQTDPELAGVGCVIFDEFHERGLQADFGLALALEIRGALRPDLRLIVMSATLETQGVAALMGDAPVVTASGRAWPVETVWLERPWTGTAGVRFEAAVGDLVEKALRETEGGVLVFLPGQAEIARVARRLGTPEGVAVQPLHGGLPFAAQRAALEPVRGGRKVVLATSIAETSLTIPDVRVVVDGGRARRARHDPGSGMSRLVTERVTRAEAEQRRGRAGRVAPGWCYRLWTRGEEGALAAHAPPEIENADLAGLALDLAIWGVADPGRLAFLTQPPGPALAEARALLADLGALDGLAATAHGRALARLPLHPRLGHMLVEGARRGAGFMCADLAALLGARDPVRGGGVDLGLRLKALGDPGGSEVLRADGIDRGAIGAIQTEARRLRALVPGVASSTLSVGGAVSLAYPDRIGRRRPGDAPRYVLSGGKGVVLPEADGLAEARFLVAVDTDGDPREARVRLAAPITEAEVRDLHAGRLVRARICTWSRRDRAVLARERLSLGAVTLEDRPWPGATPAALLEAMIAGVRDLGLEALPWTPAARRFRARVEWLRAQGTALPDFSEAGLMADLETWLGPFLTGMTRAEDLGRVGLLAALEARLDWAERTRLEEMAPAEIIAPTGTRLPIEYAGAAPSVSVRLQEMFGLTRHPTLGPERTALAITLLSPAQRPVQITSDLPGFWETSYDGVRKDLRGRYPRHYWPEDPRRSEPTRRVKPRGA